MLVTSKQHDGTGLGTADPVHSDLDIQDIGSQGDVAIRFLEFGGHPGFTGRYLSETGLGGNIGTVGTVPLLEMSSTILVLSSTVFEVTGLRTSV